MLKFPKFLGALALAGIAISTSAQASGDVAKGEKLFNRCKACHAVGAGAKNKIGPHLNEVFGRTAGTIDGFKYSSAMKKAGEGNLVWSEETIDEFLAKPRTFVKGTKMSFAGFRKEADRENVIAYLKTFSETGADAKEEAMPATEEKMAAAAPAAAPRPLAKDAELPSHGVFHLGRRATDEEIAAWDIDIRPDGAGLPDGKGTAAAGEPIFTEQCASCHGDFGEGRDRWPVLAGGFDTLQEERPEKTVGSYWPYLSTVYDYVRRAMPFGDARSLSDDEVYAITAYILYLNDIVTDLDFELSKDNFSTIKLPNEANFVDDDRPAETHYTNKTEPCMQNCKADVRITGRARVLDVTPDDDNQGGQIE